jgi:hypothetical protein
MDDIGRNHRRNEDTQIRWAKAWPICPPCPYCYYCTVKAEQPACGAKLWPSEGNRRWEEKLENLPRRIRVTGPSHRPMQWRSVDGSAVRSLEPQYAAT